MDRQAVIDGVAEVLDFPTSFDAPTFSEWKQRAATAVLDALSRDDLLALLGAEQVGWVTNWPESSGRLWALGIFEKPLVGQEPVYRIKEQP